jgi:hypothetical protein
MFDLYPQTTAPWGSNTIQHTLFYRLEIQNTEV